MVIFNGNTQSFFLFASTYTNKGSKGIYVYSFDAKKGITNPVSNTDIADNPSYLAIASGGNFLYAVNETGGDKPGGVSAYSFDRKTGKLKFINQQESGGDHPCYVAVNKKRTWLAAGNYTGGNLSMLPINSDGSLQPAIQKIQHFGKGVHKQQEIPHVHATVFSPDEQYVFVPDLGTDKVVSYSFKPKNKIVLTSFSSANTEPGSGPRHLVFHPNNKWAYLIEELSGSIQAFDYKKGSLSKTQRISTHPADYKGAKGSADIHLSPDGKFLYASNRGDANNITIFSIDKNGKLNWRGYQSTLGVHPRNFMIDPTGSWLLVANKDTDNVVIFKRNKHTGMLTASGNEIKISSPVFLQMIKQ